ncbi:coiled-coil domain-containing protein 158 [Cyanistes caeruleus]|uniref:coiled-coil domain-containing protein 158 n=1 Tax=Cyanistes caeruleus TaxID=156563 RepID=UPI000CDA8B80|nr:coiled-coil domain-containing protein 158 [Cyanistes caeruleus]XP_023782872.1 coiled-coil domain-containing protein 158 [Cyanistes caeruleus]XP_023782873.1 coiled-coil domain-containing protein 158 [Cyanistes caeruleus]XP_023782874.1 coiled-coil domain-containing protein 158 [Cyanistes caeruleus]
METQLERDALQDSRQKELQSQENLQTQLKNSPGELEAASQQQDGVLSEADSQNERLTKVVHSLEELLLELCGILMDCRDSRGRKLSEHGDMTSLSTAFRGVLQDLDSQVSHLKGKLVLVEDLEKQLHVAHLEAAEAQTDQTQHGQEPANLNDRIHQLLTELHKKERTKPRKRAEQAFLGSEHREQHHLGAAQEAAGQQKDGKGTEGNEDGVLQTNGVPDVLQKTRKMPGHSKGRNKQIFCLT